MPAKFSKALDFFAEQEHDQVDTRMGPTHREDARHPRHRASPDGFVGSRPAQAKLPVPSGKLVDVMALDVAGVRLGMTVKDAVEALKNNFKGDGGRVEVDKLPSPSPLLPAGKTYIERVQYLKDGAAVVQVYFVIGVPVNAAQPEVASSVSYSAGSIQENQKRLQQAAHEKYGAPTYRDATLPEDQWCAKVEPRTNDDLSEGCKRTKPALRLTYQGLKLEDPTALEKVRAEVERRQIQGKPKI
jgi:hypothetical protein